VERDPVSVRSVGKAFFNHITLHVFTLERNPVSMDNVGKPLSLIGSRNTPDEEVGKHLVIPIHF
jgi:hypothetical protein